MNTSTDNFAIFQSIEELVTALSEGERTRFNHILHSTDLKTSVFDKFSSWSEETYTRNCIVNNDKFELILLCWEVGHTTPIHDHGGEECWVKILEGDFLETIYKEDEDGILNVEKSTVSKKNDITYMVDFMGFHSLKNVSNQRSMSLHLYAKPIRHCKMFDTDTGELVKRNLEYDTITDF